MVSFLSVGSGTSALAHSVVLLVAVWRLFISVTYVDVSTIRVSRFFLLHFKEITSVTKFFSVVPRFAT